MWCPDLVICTCFVIQMSWEDRFVCFSFKKVKIGFQSNKLKSPKIKRLVNSVSVLSLQEKTETETRQKGFSASRIKDNNFCKVKKTYFSNENLGYSSLCTVLYEMAGGEGRCKIIICMRICIDFHFSGNNAKDNLWYKCDYGNGTWYDYIALANTCYSGSLTNLFRNFTLVLTVVGI